MQPAHADGSEDGKVRVGLPVGFAALKGYFLAGNTSPQVIKSETQIDCPINKAFQCVIEQDDEDLKTFYVLIDSPQL